MAPSFADEVLGRRTNTRDYILFGRDPRLAPAPQVKTNGGPIALIVGRTSANILRVSSHSPLDPHPNRLQVFEWIFMVLFTLELLFNMFGHWFTKFWLSGWNVFDFIIVMISAIALFFEGVPGIDVLRLFRAFRVLRLFKRIPDLKIIIDSLVSAIPGFSNAFFVLSMLNPRVPLAARCSQSVTRPGCGLMVLTSSR